MNEPTRKRGRPNIVGIDKGMGPLEAQVLRAIANLPTPTSVRQVCDALAKDGYFAYQGVLNCMNRLARKGILVRTKPGAAFVYEPAVDLEELAAKVVTNVLQHMGGELDRVVCRVLDIDPDIGAAQIADLRRRVRAMVRRPKR